jgi:hypothetical protein
VLFVLADTLLAVFWIVFLLMAAYLTLQALEVLVRILPSVGILPKENQLMSAQVYYWCSCFVMFIVICTVLGSTTYMNANDGDRIRLRKLESVQYLAMADAEANANCPTGVQKNPLLQLMGGFSTDTKFGDGSVLHGKNPVNFKVFHWMHWWEFAETSLLLQEPDLYLCSLSMDQYFGTCKTQYEAAAQAFNPDFQPAADDVAKLL